MEAVLTVFFLAVLFLVLGQWWPNGKRDGLVTRRWRVCVLVGNVGGGSK